MQRTVDYSALTAPATREEVRAFKERARLLPQYAASSSTAQLVVGILVSIFALFILVTIGGVFTALFVSLASSGLQAETVPFLAAPVIVVVVFAIIGGALFRGLFGPGRWEEWMRLSRFADANGLVFSPASASPDYPGAIFRLGHDRVARSHFRSAADRYFDFGNYAWVTGSGKNRTTHQWGYLALSLDRALPHMVLDSTANNGLFGGSNLPATFTKDQRLPLEGDFNEHFTLYCPKEYERDALYVFTPDLMALLIDNAAPFDVEIIDTWLFVYSSRPFPATDPATYQRLFRIIDTIGAKALSQTDRYADERVGDFTANVVAEPGKRLKRGISVGTVIFVLLFGAVWAWTFISDAFELLSP